MKKILLMLTMVLVLGFSAICSASTVSYTHLTLPTTERV